MTSGWLNLFDFGIQMSNYQTEEPKFHFWWTGTAGEPEPRAHSSEPSDVETRPTSLVVGARDKKTEIFKFNSVAFVSKIFVACCDYQIESLSRASKLRSGKLSR